MLRRKPFKFFNPRLREGGDLKIWRLCIMHQIFNPRLREGGDECFSIRQRKQYIFNPRLREGGDGIFIVVWGANLIFSIHTSAKEATISRIITVFCYNLFNPRLREGGDRQSSKVMYPLLNFQSTPPRRRRHSIVFSWII